MMRRFGWALRRELWENRWLYLVPAALAATIVVGFVAYIVASPSWLSAVASRHTGGQTAPLVPWDASAGFMIFTAHGRSTRPCGVRPAGLAPFL